MPSDHTERVAAIPTSAVITADHTDNVRLRCWDIGGAAAIIDVFADPSMATQIDVPPADIDAATEWVNARRQQWESATAYSFAVDCDGELAGSVTVSAIDRRHDIGWISYWTAAEHRGRGIAASALRALARWAFDDLGLFRLELGHRVNNPASCGVALAAGFAVEGLERAKLRYGDERFDVELHARLATD